MYFSPYSHFKSLSFLKKSEIFNIGALVRVTVIKFFSLKINFLRTFTAYQVFIHNKTIRTPYYESLLYMNFLKHTLIHKFLHKQRPFSNNVTYGGSRIQT